MPTSIRTREYRDQPWGVHSSYFSAGNCALDNDNPGVFNWPASIRFPDGGAAAVTVASVAGPGPSNDQLSTFSDFGKAVTLAAPGEDFTVLSVGNGRQSVCGAPARAAVPATIGAETRFRCIGSDRHRIDSGVASRRDLLRAQVFTVEAAARELVPKLGASFGALRLPPRTVTSAEFRLLRSFLAAAREVMHACGVDALKRKAAMPEYPEGRDAVEALIPRLEARRPA